MKGAISTSPLPVEPTAHASDFMHVIARVGSERFAFRVADVEEVLDAPKFLVAPSEPAGLRGQVMHRERTLRAYDGAWALAIARHGDGTLEQTDHTLVLRDADRRVALLVDDVEDLTPLDPATLRAVPAGTDPYALLRGVCLPAAGRTSSEFDAGALIGVVNTAAVVSRVSA